MRGFENPFRLASAAVEGHSGPGSLGHFPGAVDPGDPRVFATAVGADPAAKAEVIKANHRILIRDRGQWWFLSAAQIRFFESVGNHTYVFANEKIRVPRSLKEIQERLDPTHFIRANRKHIVNISHITAIADGENGGLLVTIDEAFKVPMVRPQAARLRQLFGL
jgi:DNA-binding LytR/AlgR family response regulator